MLRFRSPARTRASLAVVVLLASCATTHESTSTVGAQEARTTVVHDLRRP